MSFKASGLKTRPERVKPPSAPTDSAPLPPSWEASRRDSVSSASSTASFHDARFPADEEQRMVESSNEVKKSANTQFAAADFSSAISTYDRALAELPSYLNYELAVLQSNIAACHVRLEQWKEAIDACESGLAGLERELPTKKKPKPTTAVKSKVKGRRKNGTNPNTTGDALNSDTDSEAEAHQPNTDANDTVIELPSDASDSELAAHLTTLNISDGRRRDIIRIRTKLLLRRARARSSIDPPTWTNLGGALEDYKLLSTPEYLPSLPLSDQRTVRQGLVELPGRVNEAKEKEVGEMMGKLKELGNGLLKPFGLSTDMFKMVKDENSGGYSMSFDQGGSKK